jgi:signal transduction histidine kinase
MSEFSPLASPKIKTRGPIRRAARLLWDYTWPQGRVLRQLRGAHAQMQGLLTAPPLAFASWQVTHPHAPLSHCLVSPHLPQWLQVSAINTPEDVIYALNPHDAAAVDGLYQRLLREGQNFAVRVKTADHTKTYSLFGTRHALPDGAPDNADGGPNSGYAVALWFTDITQTNLALDQARAHEHEWRQQTLTWQNALDSLPYPAWLRDATGRITWANKAYSTALDLSPDAVLDTQAEILGSKASVGRALALRALTNRENVQDKHHVIIKGTRRLLQLSEIYLSLGRQTLGLAEDLTAFEEVQDEQKRFRASTTELLRALNTGIAIFNPKQDVAFYNTAFAELFRLDEAWLDQKPSCSALMETMREKRRLPEQADFKIYKRSWLDRFTSLINTHEEMMHLPDGTAIRLSVVPHPLGGLFMTFEDVTSRLELESNYNTLIAVQRETIDNLAEGLAVFGADGRLRLFNNAYVQLWGFNKAELNGTPHINSLMPAFKNLFDATPDDLGPTEMLRQAAISRQEERGRMVLKDSRVIEYATVPLPDGGMLNRFNDVTDTTLVERALREKNAALEAAERLKLDFLANVSYQLRTPLNAMMGFAEVLDQKYFGPLTDRQKEYTVGMIEAGQKLIGLVNDILDLSTIEAGYLELQKRPLDVAAMMHSLWQLTQEWARAHNIEITLDCPKNIGKLDADERRLKQVLLNLISNAIKFTGTKGHITLTANRHGRGADEAVHFTVKDTGVGISPEDQAKIFSPFVRLKQNQGHAGAGLGLSLVKSIVELHGGSVSLDSAEGVGTTITCAIPIITA